MAAQVASNDGFTASNGAVLPAPDPEGLDCAAMDEVLQTYVASGYRWIGAVPQGHPDRPIFDYENRLAAQHFYRCQARQSRFTDPEPVFSSGFN